MNAAYESHPEATKSGHNARPLGHSFRLKRDHDPTRELPFDIVHLIVAYISPHDLPSLALVCHLFNAAATPKIYANIRYTHLLAKQWGQILCPVELLSVRPDLLGISSLSVRNISLLPPLLPDNRPHAPVSLRLLRHSGRSSLQRRSSPTIHSASIHVVKHTPGLASFSWATAGLYDSLLLNILRILAPGNGTPNPIRAGTSTENTCMFDQHHDLSNTNSQLLRLSLTEDGLSSTDAHVLQRLGPVEHMALHKPSLGATRALVDWITSVGPPLSSLTISNTYHLDSPLLTRILSNTPKLKSLSITNCLRIEPCSLFSIITDTSLPLESLTFTLPRDAEYDSLGATFPSLPTLRHLSVLIEPPASPTRTGTPPRPIRSHNAYFGIYSKRSEMSISRQRAYNHPRTDTAKTELFKLALSAYSVADVLKHVSNLEQLSLELGGVLDDLDLIIEALPAAQHLHTLIDTSPTVTTTTHDRNRNRWRQPQPPHHSADPKPLRPKFRALTRAQAGLLLEAGPVLANVVSQQRNWADETNTAAEIQIPDHTHPLGLINRVYL
ncbi:F-box-like protein [Rhizoctonia solani]|uniref:F-box-like protein n=1 Tax=Rhizoctonia solani TaxID=456999 RepID=A0A8H8P7S2_9AGAM|nr:F-box-like protein [Rhizoctonia solani]QRW26115.1 F-box-like protein [Rhizoctonia solani]